MSYMSGPGIYPNLGESHNDEVRTFAVGAVLSDRMSLISAAVWYRVQVADLQRWIADAHARNGRPDHGEHSS
jgi:hypothetical protein